MNAPVPAAHARRVAIIDRDTPPIPPPLDERNPPPIGNASQPSLYKFEHWEDIGFDLDEEFLIDGILPRHGVGLLYGPSQSLKSFVAMHLGLSVTQGQSWAGRKAEPAPVLYIGAEGAAGLRKRKHGYVHAGRAPNSGVNFTLLSAAPNLGTAEGDHAKLIASIEASGIAPKLLIIDTIAKVIGGADENGAGMAQFLVNAQELAQHFAGFVLAVHHTGWNDEAKDRPRGWSGLPAALDVQILSERKAGEMSAILTVQKLKDEPSGLRLEAQMQRIILGIGKTGREISTLIVDEVTELTPQATPQAPSAAAIPKTLRLLFAVLDQALDDHGQEIQAFGTNGTKVRAVADSHVKKIYSIASPIRLNPTRIPISSPTASGKISRTTSKPRLSAKPSLPKSTTASASCGEPRGRANDVVLWSHRKKRKPLRHFPTLPEPEKAESLERVL